MLARLVQAEAGNQPMRGKKAVAQVVLNRLVSKRFEKSLHAVIYARHQFARPSKNASKESFQAALAALEGEQILPAYIYNFQRAKARYFYGKWYTMIGAHNFYGNPPKATK